MGRWLAIGAAAAAGWGLLAAAAAFVLGAWLDLLWEFSPQLRITVLSVAAIAGLLAIAALVGRSVAGGGAAAIARRLDLAIHSGGQILTGLELDAQYPAGGGQMPLRAGLGRIAVEHATALAARAPLAKAIPARPLVYSAAAVAFFALFAAVLVLLAPEVARTEWDRFTQPYADVPPYSPLHISVSPGDVSLLYGGELEVTAQTDALVEQVEFVLETEDGETTALPMFPESEGSWRTVLAKVTEPGRYFVRAHRSRSPRYRLDLVTVPQIEEVRVRIEPPEYARQAVAVVDGAIPEEGIRGLRGTKVSLTITSNRPLSGGRIVLQAPSAAPGRKPLDGQAGEKPEATAVRAAPRIISMTPSGPDSSEVRGEFEITADGTLECRVIDDAGQTSQQAVAASIALVTDQHPFVRILQPQAMSLATPTAVLPVVLSAEDDCGLSRIELFRSLNESRPLPADLPAGTPRPRRAERQVGLPLARYGLAPGDVIKLFGRVEDNDPAGPKGSESQVVTVRIISQEDFERMLRNKKGLEVLLARYREARRRMEGLAKETEGLRSKLKKTPKGSPISPEVREGVRQLRRLLRTDAQQMAAAAHARLPYDIDERLSPEIGSAAALTEQMAKELEKLEQQTDLLGKDLEKKLEEMAARLGGERSRFQAQAMEPLEHLEAVFPLLVAQSRFVALALRQKDLAERMAALKGHDSNDDPKLKTRMRDLEYEQGQVREALDALLDDIEDHASRLPDVPELKKLRETAQKFAKDVRASGAGEAMRGAETALEDFRGTEAHRQAASAAEILERFINRCEGEDGLEGMCKGCLVFQPSLARGLGNTVAQLLADMGGGGGMSGSGGAGGYGLYGQMGGMSGLGSGEYGDPSGEHGGSGQPRAGSPWQGANVDRASADGSPLAAAATAASDATVPARYRERVGQYFQRLAEEIGQQPPGPRRKK